MKKEDIKPIPKYILKLIEKTDKHYYPNPDGHNRFYAYLTRWKKELIKVTVAAKHYKKKWYCKQVAFHGVHSKMCYVKDLEYCGFVGLGFRVGWYDEGLQSYKKFFEYGLCSAEDKYYDPWAPIVNMDFVSKFPEYQYSAYKLYHRCTLFKYLRIYEQFPQAEYLLKLNMTYYATSKMILRQLAKSLPFRKWFLSHKDEIRNERYYVETILTAFKQNRPMKEVQWERQQLKDFCHNSEYKELRQYFNRTDALRLMRYLKEKYVSGFTYYDYYHACTTLGLDMTEDKNRFPHDFRRWHDIRIDQYKTQKAIQDEKERQKHYEQFKEVAQKYLTLQHDKRSAFICLIAKSPAELVNEGKQLHHCVGSMNYDQRFIQERSLIFFIRNRETPDKPFVTVEYSLSQHKVLQCYGASDSRPNDTVLHYVNKIWLPYANKQLKQLAA